MSTHFNTWNELRDAYTNRHEPEAVRTLAEMYWRGLLFVTFCFALCVIGLGVLRLTHIFTGTESEKNLVPSTALTPTLNVTELEATVQGLENRRVEYDARRTNPPSVTDPSR